MDIKLVIYYLCIAIGGIASAVIGFNLGKKKGFSSDILRTGIIFGLVTGIVSALLMGQLQNFIMSLTGLEFYPSRLRIFGALLFLPPFFYFFTKYLGGDFGRVLDVFTPGIYAMLGIAKIGCAVYGCCYGIPFSHGVSTPFEEHRVFPVQLLECVLSILISVFAYYLAVRKKYRKGTVYPISLILYGIMRFSVEFLRYYPEAEKTFFFGMSFWQMISVISIIFGIVLFIINRQKTISHGNKNLSVIL